MINKKIFIFVSEVATIINENPYDLIKPFNRLINKYADINFEKITNTLITKEETLKANPIFIESLKTLSQKFGNDLNSVKQNLIPSVISTATNKGEIPIDIDIQTVKNIINTDFGVCNELNAIAMFEKKFNLEGKLDTTQKFYSKLICSIITETKNGPITYDYYLGGKCDAITEDYVLEIKNRIHKFFNCLKDYEKVQVQLYMYLLNKNKSKLVEKYKNNIKVIDIYENKEYTENILSKLITFCSIFSEFLQDESKIYYYISLNDNDKKSFLYDLYLKKLTLSDEEVSVECELY